jgi:hypothetical protein
VPRRTIRVGARNAGIAAALAALACGMAFLAARPACAAAPNAPLARRVVIVLMSGMTWRDLDLPQADGLRKAIGSGLAADLNCATLGRRTVARAMVTLSAGSRADAGSEAGDAYRADAPFENENAAEAYVRRTGHLPGDAQMLHLGIASIDRANAVFPDRIRPGLLGSAVGDLGLKTAVLGDADTALVWSPGTRHREAAALAMDEFGRVSYGGVGQPDLVPAPEMAYGVRSNASQILMRYSILPEDAGLVVIDFGDTIRAARYSSEAQPSARRFLRARAMASASDFVSRLIQLTSEKDAIIIMSPVAVDGGPDPAPMTPFSLLMPGGTPGYATSATTRRPGIVVGTDLVRTVRYLLSGNDVASGDIPGRPIVASSGGGGSLEALAAESDRATLVDRLRPGLLFAWAFLVTVGGLLALGLMLAGPNNESSFRLTEALLVFVSSLPLAGFVAGWATAAVGRGSLGAQLATPLGYATLVIAPAVALAAALALSRMPISRQLFVVMVATVGVLIADQLAGAPAAIDTVFGYSPIEGGRYYGMGNEAWAIAFSCVALTLAIWLDWTPGSWPRRRIAVVGVLIGLTLVVGLPVLGSNLGGFIAVGLGAVTFCAVLLRRHFKPWMIAAAAVAIAAAAALLIGLDMMRAPMAGTHFAGIGRMIANGDLSALGDIVGRKLSMNVETFNQTLWSWVLLLAVTVFVVDARRAGGLLGRFLEDRPALSAALIAILASSAAGMFIEDTGIAIPAYMLGVAFPVVTALMLAAARWRLTTLQP